MPLTAKENELRLRARGLIEQGALPGTLPDQAWGGYGTGATCAVCDQPISATEVEYEVRDTSTGETRDFHFHFMCHAAWQFECARHDHLSKLGQDEPGGRKV